MTGAPTAPTAVTSPQITLTVVIGPNGCTYNPYDYTVVINDVSLSLSPSIVKLGTDLTLTLNGNKVSAKKKVTAIRIYSSNTPGLTTASPIDGGACLNSDKWCRVFGAVGSSCFKEVEQAPNEVITLGTALGSVNMNCAPDNPFAFVDASKLYYRFDVNWEATPGVPGPPNRRDVFSMLPANNGSNSVVATIEMPMKEGLSAGVVAGIVTASVAILAIGAIVILKRQKAKKNLDKHAKKNLTDETAEPFVTAL
ncbi:hypothetical protein HDU99_002502 [Rhizoclosmatium hyalinum]|nr:hypothetical protein HDU99_002502 [Rhizoclosmatium hyalinum]